MIYALGSNIISYLLKKDLEIINRYRCESMKGNEFVIPHVAYYEVKRWLLEIGAKNKQMEFDKLCLSIPLGEISKPEWDIASVRYAQMRKIGKPVDDADLIIAAFCINNGYTLITNNVRHFEDIEGLVFENWKG
jgi:predicted nucleic acid-binding protein